MPERPEEAGGPLARFLRAARLFRPRTLAQLGRSDEKLQQQIDALSSDVRTLKMQLREVSVREQELQAALDPGHPLNQQVAAFDRLVRETPIAEHVKASIEGARLESDPFPHCVIDEFLPREYYDALIAALPPAEMFGDRPDNKQQLTVPFESAPRYSAQVWHHMARVVVEEMIAPGLFAKFHDPVTAWMHETLPALGDTPLEAMRFTSSDGRIMLRRRGYRIPPHRDPKWGFITCLTYLVRPGDDERWGTQLFSVDDDAQAPGAAPHWIADSRCRLVRDVSFKANRALVFLNSAGAHGAQIPEDAQPPDLERYLYQFRIGPSRPSMRLIRERLTPEQRALWPQKAGEY